ncbi:sugar transferase [Macrococcus armenti]|uniref:sugar transferase n=1 Tax=Macrococcus armenti TaxID=2875764 RepID=UPI001CCA19CE|nr:sugar transferase [Macrococcus armenti]UBH09367.1 sugar transferase [Macrococcus armenti]
MKRAFDLIVSVFSILILSPVFIVTYFYILKNLGKPVFFNQERPGKNEKIFKLYKFRTMKNLYDKDNNLLSDELRMSDAGKKVRDLSLDELPQLFNVLKGDLSIVGPRPLLKEYLPLYNKEQKKRHNIRPGLTGWAQVNGRNSLSWDEKFKLDVWYVENRSFLLDLKIIFMTIRKVLRRSDIQHEGHVTMEKFKGNM